MTDAAREREIEERLAKATPERLDSFVTGVVGKRLTYKQLIH
jgi:hypothetical protein